MSHQTAPTTASDMEAYSDFEPLSYDDGDVVLRAGDTDFRVHSFMLRQASPFFRTLFSLPQPSNSSREERVIIMSESRDVVDKLLRWIYPLRTRPTLASVEEARALSEAADKLEIDCAIEPILLSLTSLLAAEPNALRAWALAVLFKHESAKLDAALRFIRFTTPNSAHPRVTELNTISALDYADLLACRQEAHKKAKIATAYEMGSWWGCKRCCKDASSQHKSYNSYTSSASSSHVFTSGSTFSVSESFPPLGAPIFPSTSFGSPGSSSPVPANPPRFEREAPFVPEWYANYRERIADRNPLVDDVSSDGLFDACVASSSCANCKTWYDNLGANYRPAPFVRKKLEAVHQWVLRELHLL